VWGGRRVNTGTPQVLVLVQRLAGSSRWVPQLVAETLLCMEEDPQVAGQVGGTGMHPRVKMPLAVVEAIWAIGGMTTDVLDPGRLVVGEVHEWRAVREEAVWVGRCRAPAGVQACRRAVRRLRYLVKEHREGGGAELEFNAGNGDPAVQPQAWLQHFGACVQAANGKPYVCLACCTT